MVSLPRPPLRDSAVAAPITESLAAEKVRFSKPVRAKLLFVARSVTVPVLKLAVTPAAETTATSVSLTPPPPVTLCPAAFAVSTDVNVNCPVMPEALTDSTFSSKPAKTRLSGPEMLTAVPLTTPPLIIPILCVAVDEVSGGAASTIVSVSNWLA
ncbi:MAG: hypothetical protein EB072_03075 [Betaproteobacteria bacterium]|nr:hypothetical protein [Betaproteobacteria bacterium]NDD11636.1 hypothetical protein [Betaproteobacteria bacterium]